MKAIVLAGGKGTRLNSAKENIPKVMRKIGDKHLIEYCLESLRFINEEDTTIVVGFEKEKIIDHLGNAYNYAVQEKQLGTGHAALMTEELLKDVDDDVIIIYGDMPLIKHDTFKAMIDKHKEEEADLTVLTVKVENMLPYGRIIRSEEGKLIDIVEEKDTDETNRHINELNVGVNVIKLKYLYKGLRALKNNNVQGEYYLTDLVKIFVNEGKKIVTHTIYDENEIRGINTIEDLEFAKKVLLG